MQRQSQASGVKRKLAEFSSQVTNTAAQLEHLPEVWRLRTATQLKVVVKKGDYELKNDVPRLMFQLGVRENAKQGDGQAAWQTRKKRLVQAMNEYEPLRRIFQTETGFN